MTTIPWDNYNTTAVTSGFQLPVFADIAAPVFDDINVTSAEWDGIQVVISATNTQASAILTATYNGIGYTMTEDSVNNYSVSITDGTFVNSVQVTSNQAGDVTATVTDTTALTDLITITSAAWDGDRADELVIDASNTVAGAELLVVYNNVAYPMTETGANTYTVSIDDPVYAGTATVTSNYGGHSVPTVYSVSISVTLAEWNGLNVGS